MIMKECKTARGLSDDVVSKAKENFKYHGALWKSDHLFRLALSPSHQPTCLQPQHAVHALGQLEIMRGNQRRKASLAHYVH